MHRHILLAVVGLATIGLIASGCSSASTAPRTPTPEAENCAWPSVVGVHTYNKGAPDPMAAYWDQPIVAGQSTRITISGTYPDARYFSLSVYAPDGTPVTAHGLPSSLTDYQIAPAKGSVNPWQHQAAPGGSYQVTLERTATAGDPNVLPLPAGTSAAHPGYLVYRLYLPADGNVDGATPPSITLGQGSTSRILPMCRTHIPIATPTVSSGATPPAAPQATPPAEGAFFGLPAAEYAAGLADANTSYAEAYILRPPANDVMIVTAKAPTYPSSNSPTPWPQGADMRYWSMCIVLGVKGAPIVANKLPNGQTDYGCREDYQTKIVGGRYMYVIGTESQKAAISRVSGTTFLPLPTAQTTQLYFLLLRNKLVAPGFNKSPQEITRAADAAAAATAMGRYYPKVTTCALSTLTAGGITACRSQ